MTALYNECEPYAAAWLRELIAAGHIAPGDVDERPIQELKPNDVEGYTQFHAFAGIGVWSYALRLSGWPDSRPVWTGSCPCQPFSSAARGRGKGLEDERHLWPHWRDLIAAIRPRAIFGEQVAQAGDWLDGVCADLEAMGYEVGAAVLPALAVGQDHARPRIYFAGHADSHGESGVSVDAEASRVPGARGKSRSVVPAHGPTVRVAQLRALGNAIVPQVALEFVAAYMEVRR